MQRWGGVFVKCLWRHGQIESGVGLLPRRLEDSKEEKLSASLAFAFLRVCEPCSPEVTGLRQHLNRRLGGD
jgi:hypothetical protein